MSDEEIMFGDNERNEEEEEDDDEYNVFLKEELIAFVKANPALYAKNYKEYAGKGFCKDLTWESIGANLSKKISGKDAAKMWYNIRQRFGKERRKVVAACKGKSGQETKPLYVPKWPFYNPCLFLVDHIMPRRTASNYISKKNVNKITTVEKAALSSTCILPSSLASPSSLSRAPSPQEIFLQAPSSPASKVLISSSPSNLWSSDVESMISNDSTSVFSIENSKEKEACLHTPNFNVEECSTTVIAPLTSKDTLKKISTSIKKTIPEPDNFVKRKKKEDNLLMQTITKQSTALTSFVTKLEKSFENSDECKKGECTQSFVDDPILSAIKYALKSVPEEKHLECMIELLQIIKSKYAQQ